MSYGTNLSSGHIDIDVAISIYVTSMSYETNLSSGHIEIDVAIAKYVTSMSYLSSVHIDISTFKVVRVKVVLFSLFFPA